MVMQLETLVENGLYYSQHAKQKMALENITEQEVKEVLLNGIAKFDRSNQNDKSRAWNKKPHHSSFWNGLTVVWCESYEKGVMVVSVYHGESHNITSNPYQKRLRTQ